MRIPVLAVLLLAALTAVAQAPAVTYIPSEKVDAAFAKGMSLLEGTNYKIMASRREADGIAEIHDRDIDILYFLGGTATLVTGGKVPDAKVTASEEKRGGNIVDGENRRVHKGDIVVIPNGVPHQFKEVAAPFTYYVVKVRSLK
jgi:glc operon protein GlcG